MNGSCRAIKACAESESTYRRVNCSPRQTANGLSQRLNQSDFMEELLPLLSRFTAIWEQNVVLGDHRWERENMKATQRFAKGLLREPLEFDSRYSDSSDAEIRNRVHLLSTELRQFFTPDIRGLSIQDREVMVAHGKVAYEMTGGLSSYLEPEKLTRRPSDERSKRFPSPRSSLVRFTVVH